jgi:hypothetical protein
VAGFRSVEEFRRVFGGFVDALRRDDPVRFAGSGIVVVHHLTDLDVNLVFDTTVEPHPGAMFDVRIGKSDEPNPTCVFEMTSETFESLFLGTLSPIVALATRAAKARGRHLEAMRTIPALQRAIPLYRQWRERHPG